MRSKHSRRGGRGKAPEPGLTKEDLLKMVQKSADRGMNIQRILEDFETTPGARKQIKDILNQLVKEGWTPRPLGPYHIFWRAVLKAPSTGGLQSGPL